MREMRWLLVETCLTSKFFFVLAISFPVIIADSISNLSFTRTMTTLLHLPNELLLQIIEQIPVLSLANKRLYFIGYRFMAASVIGVGGMDRNGFDSRRHCKSDYRRFISYLNSLSPSVAGSVKWVDRRARDGGQTLTQSQKALHQSRQVSQQVWPAHKNVVPHQNLSQSRQT